MTIDTQAQFITDVQSACRKAKETKSRADLETARVLMMNGGMNGLPTPAAENLRWAYADAVMSVTGAGAS